MATEEHEIAIEIVCTHLPGTAWDGRGPVSLGIQKGEEVTELAPADLERIVFRPEFRVRRHTDGSPTFLGPFAHGPRAERFIYLVWAIPGGNAHGERLGRVKVHLSHIQWPDVESAAARQEPLRATLELTNATGKPVFASVRADTARWEL